MYYSYVEIEYIATSFSPTRTDLTLKLLKMFLEINATTDKGMNVVAKRYGLVNEWRDTIKESKEEDRATKNYKLLVLVKTTSKKDNV
jgi:hypothetical protein